MFGNDSKPSKIYRYGCLEPTSGLDEINQQIWLMHRYRNALCELEHKRRDRWNAIVESASPGIAALKAAIESGEAELETVKAEIGRERVRQRTKRIAGPLADKKAQLCRLLKDQRTRLKEMKAVVKSDARVAEKLKALDEETGVESKRLRASSGLYWGNYSVIEQAAGGFRSGPPPKFLRWQPEGKVAVQCQGGLSAADCMEGTDQRLRIRLTGKRGRKHQQLAICSFRIGSTETGRAVFAEVPMIVHRPLPSDSRVKWAYLHKRRIGTRWRWELSIIVSRETDWPIPNAAETGKVGIDIGYKASPDGLLVATWSGLDGKSGSLAISADDLNRWHESAARRSVRDQTLNAIREMLIEFRGSAELPEWFTERTKAIHQWRSANRFAALAIHWKESRFAGDADAFDSLEAWRANDEREFNSEAGQRARAIRWRDDFYRNFVAKLRQRYRKAIVREVDWASVAELPAKQFVPDDARGNRFIAAPGRLVQLIEEGFVEFERVKLASPAKKREFSGTKQGETYAA